MKTKWCANAHHIFLGKEFSVLVVAGTGFRSRKAQDVVIKPKEITITSFEITAIRMPHHTGFTPGMLFQH